MHMISIVSPWNERLSLIAPRKSFDLTRDFSDLIIEAIWARFRGRQVLSEAREKMEILNFLYLLKFIRKHLWKLYRMKQ